MFNRIFICMFDHGFQTKLCRNCEEGNHGLTQNMTFITGYNDTCD